jgi:hypothetical protein
MPGFVEMTAKEPGSAKQFRMSEDSMNKKAKASSFDT